MPSPSPEGDYKADGRPDKTGAPDWFGRLEEFLQLLARTVRQFHTYPATSPLCTEAVAACHKAFTALDRHDRLSLRITPHEMLADDRPMGAGTIIEQELVRRLHRAHVAAIDLDHAASPRDFTRFCTDILRSETLADTKTTFAELLIEHGVELIVPRMAHRPEVLDIGTRPAQIWNIVERDRKRRNAIVAQGPAQYLYPPEKGWVRVQSSVRTETISLADLVVLVDDPADVATMLLRLTDDDPIDMTGGDAKRQALEQKFGDVATLFSALDPHLAQLMFDKLARVVLAIDPERRKSLLQRTILPGLLDGRAAGAVLRWFPDPELADSLCLLLELETAAPEVVTAALQRLDLPADRAQAVATLVDETLRAPRASHGTHDDAREQNLDRFTRRLLRVDTETGKDFTEFAAFDLSIDQQAATAIAGVGAAIAGTDVVVAQIDCLWRLVHLEPNPTLVESFLRRATALFAELDRAGRVADLVAAARRYRTLAGSLRESRPDVADAVLGGLTSFCTPARTLTLFGSEGPDSSREDLLDAFAEALIPGFVTVLDDSARHSEARSVSTFMCQHAKRLAPALAGRLGACGPAATRAIVRACGYAGSGYEVIVSEQLISGDEQTVREALRALARIGTARAGALISHQIHRGHRLARAAAEEALWHLPPAQTELQLREILGRRDFVVHNPVIASRLIERAVQAGAGGLDGVLEELEALRFRFWQPGLVRVALKARELRAR
jgi:hypothetical protein